MSDQQRRANTATRINDPTHARIKEHNRASETLSATIDRALDALEREARLLDAVEDTVRESGEPLYAAGDAEPSDCTCGEDEACHVCGGD